MKQKITLLGLLILCATFAFAQTRPLSTEKQRLNEKIAIAKKIKRVKEKLGVPVTTKALSDIIAEDFSKFTKGSEMSPDNTDIATADDNGTFLPGYTAVEGWAGAAVYQAGGCAFVGMYEYDSTSGVEPGLIATPNLILNNVSSVTLSFRARSNSYSDRIIAINANAENDDDYTYAFFDATSDWENQSVEFKTIYPNAYYMVYFEKTEGFFDDIKVTTDISNVAPAAPHATYATNVTDTSFTANWNEVANTDYYLLNVFTLKDDNREAFVTDLKATTTSADISETTAGVQYYYTVKAVNEFGSSEESNVVTVSKIDIDPTSIQPPTPLPATDVDYTHFTANWEAPVDAEKITIVSGVQFTAPKDGEYVIWNENFDNQPSGTLDNPDDSQFSAYLDDFTQRSDWYAVIPVFAKGCVGFDNSLSAYGYLGDVESPIVNFSNGGGKIKVKADIYAKNISTVYIDLDQYNSSTRSYSALCNREYVPMQQNRWETLEVELENGAQSCMIMFAGEGSGQLFIDNVVISQEFKAGEKINIPYHYNVVDASIKSLVINTPDKVYGEQHYYYLHASKTSDSGSTITSEHSDAMFVIDSGVERVANDSDVRLTVSNGILSVNNTKDEEINVYQINGCQIAKSHGSSSSISLNERGIYLVKVGTKVYKVIY